MREYLKFYIDGAWVDPAAPARLDVINPATEAVAGVISMGSAKDADRAVMAARKAFPSYSQTSRADRVELLQNILAKYQERFAEIAAAITEEMGAPGWLAMQAQAAIGVGHLMTGIEVRAVAEPYIQRRAVRHLEKGRVIIFGAGTGNPYFTTDTAASLRAMEIDAEVLIKATKVDAVYDSDPKKNRDARRFEHLTYIDALNMRVGVMDSTAMAMCMDNDLPISVINLWQTGSLERVVLGESVGTTITS